MEVAATATLLVLLAGATAPYPASQPSMHYCEKAAAVVHANQTDAIAICVPSYVIPGEYIAFCGKARAYVRWGQEAAPDGSSGAFLKESIPLCERLGL